MKRGMTLVELMLGVVILSVISSATVMFLSSVARGWQASQSQSSANMTNYRVRQLLHDKLSSSLNVIQYANGSTRPASGSGAYIVFWSSDSFGGAADAKMQAGEVALLEYDANTKSLTLYEPLAESAMTAAQKTLANVSTWTNLAAATLPTTIKSQTFMAPPRRLLGTGSTPGASTQTPVISQANFTLTSSTQRPTLSYDLVITRGSVTTKLTGTVAMRAPRAVPS